MRLPNFVWSHCRYFCLRQTVDVFHREYDYTVCSVVFTWIFCCLICQTTSTVQLQFPMIVKIWQQLIHIIRSTVSDPDISWEGTTVVGPMKTCFTSHNSLVHCRMLTDHPATMVSLWTAICHFCFYFSLESVPSFIIADKSACMPLKWLCTVRLFQDFVGWTF